MAVAYIESDGEGIFAPEMTNPTTSIICTSRADQYAQVLLMAEHAWHERVTSVDHEAQDRADLVAVETGTVYQGGSPDASINAPPFTGPLLIVTMDEGENDEALIDHVTTEAVLSVWINDSPIGVGPLKDSVLLALADTILGFLKDGGTAYLHCAAGISRASYIDVAVHCRALGISAVEALARIKAERPVADPNVGFWTQLQRLFPGP